MELKEKVIIISGASGGMGEEIVRQLAKEGCKLAIFARREEKLKKISDEVSSDITECIYKKCDVSKKEDVQDAIDFTLSKFGRIDVAFLNAGVLIPNPIESFDGEIIKKTMRINFFGNLNFIECLLPTMKKQQKSLISVTSTLPDRRGVPGWGAYGASKAATSWLVESLRAEAKKKYNIIFVTVKPGSVETPMIDGYGRHGSITPQKAAEIMIKGVKKEKKIIAFPLRQIIINKISEQLPPSVYDILDIDKLKGDGYPEAEEK
jgi:NAD(P)-dependent dehydrogenase (short-subunit alcohol dehydrogenase family)